MGKLPLASGLISLSLGREKGELLGPDARDCQEAIMGAYGRSFLIASMFSLKGEGRKRRHWSLRREEKI